MIKPLAVGLLTLIATCSTAAFAGNGGSPPPPQSIICSIPLLSWLPMCRASQQPQPAGGPPAAPEIDTGGAVAARTLLAGGLAALRAHRSTKKDT